MKQNIKMVQLLVLLGVQIPWGPGGLQVLPTSAWDVIADIASSHVVLPTYSFFNIF